MNYHYVARIADPSCKAACGLSTWGAGTCTTQRERVTCIACVEALAPAEVAKPIAAPVFKAKPKKEPNQSIQGQLL